MNLQPLFISDLNQFITIIVIHLLAVISPGPDFTVVTRQSFLYGRKIAIMTSIGIGVGIIVHVLYCIIGVAYILSINKTLFNSFKLMGALYLFFIGIKSLYYNKKEFKKKVNSSRTQLKSFLLGFITNVFNPKATLFFLALFTTIIDCNTPVIIQIFYGLWMSLITMLWFVLVSLFFTNSLTEIFIRKYSLLINKIMGVVLIFISIKLLLF